MISNLKNPIYVQVEITSQCNNRCLYCYNFWRDNEATSRRQEFSLKQLRFLAQILGQQDIFYVTVTGGEPFLNKRNFYGFLIILGKL